MPLYVEEMTSEVAVFDGDLPLSPAQIETLVALVIRRLAEQQRDRERGREATMLRRQAAPPLRIGE
jgi:hypothetical protein